MPPKDFDALRVERNAATPVEDRTFLLGGETFVARMNVRPEVLTFWDRMDDMNVTDVLKATDDTILGLIEDTDGAHERYLALRQREEDPIVMQDLIDVGTWLVEVQTGRPTEAPSGSTDSPSTPGTNSTVASPSPVTPEASTA